MGRYLMAALTALLLGTFAEYFEATVPEAGAVGDCNTNCRTRQYFKFCGAGTTTGVCRYYEQPTCARCVFTGWCDAYDFASPWPCKVKLTTRYYEEPEDHCIHHCGCADGMQSTEGSVFTVTSSPVVIWRYNCQLFDEYPPPE